LFEKELNLNAMTLATEDWEDLDDPLQDHITIAPASFSSTQPDRAAYTFTFDTVTFTLPVQGALVRAYAFDVFGNQVLSESDLSPQGSPSPSTPPVVTPPSPSPSPSNSAGSLPSSIPFLFFSLSVLALLRAGY
jgi:hypothetical protein